MPFVKVQTSLETVDQAIAQELLTTLSAKLARHLGKPESYVMTALETAIPMTFGGSFDPTCYLEIKSVGTMGSSTTQAISQDFCGEVESRLGIPKNRVYIEFADAKGSMWGWNGSTF